MSEKNTVALNERDSSSLLSSCGVRMVASVLLDKPDRAAFEAASRQLGFPVAMKVLSDDILHKTDVGCVVLNVTDVDGMQAAYDTIMANAAKNAPGARVQGVLAEQMLPKGFEVLLAIDEFSWSKKTQPYRLRRRIHNRDHSSRKPGSRF